MFDTKKNPPYTQDHRPSRIGKMKLVVVVIGLVATAFAMPRQLLRVRDDDTDPCDYNTQSCDPNDDTFPQCCSDMQRLARCDLKSDGSYLVGIQNCVDGCVSSDSGDHCQRPE
jgi:hypothetical protein